MFSEPAVDDTFDKIDFTGYAAFAVEYLPGQFDQRADSAVQCIQLLTEGERPLIRCGRVYMLKGSLNDKDIKKIRRAQPLKFLKKTKTMRVGFLPRNA